jgi:hypothetical protein
VRKAALWWAGAAVSVLVLFQTSISWEQGPNIVLGTIFAIMGLLATIPILVAMLTPSARSWFD